MSTLIAFVILALLLGLATLLIVVLNALWPDMTRFQKIAIRILAMMFFGLVIAILYQLINHSI